MSSMKGKGKEEVHWQLGWWELQPLLDRARRPLIWSKSPIIFSAHPTKPLVLARHFNTSRQFELPVHSDIQHEPDAYSPPTLITVSPNEDWIFAYFPKLGGGISCLWRRGGRPLDAWAVHEAKHYHHDGGIVAAQWIHSNREWVVNDAGGTSRMPPIGPALIIRDLNNPILLLVTQSREIEVIIPAIQQVRIRRFKASLVQSGVHNKLASIDEPSVPSLGGRYVCVAAAMSMSYMDQSILIAMRSQLVPPDDFGPSANDAMNMVLNMDQPIPHLNGLPFSSSNVWDFWGEDPTIELCEVTLTNELMIKPMPSIQRPGAHIVDLKFCCSPPEPPGSSSPLATKDPRRQAKEQAEKRGNLYLAATFLNCSDYTSPPRSEVNLYTFTKNPTGSPRWILNKEHARTFDTAVLGFMIPAPTKTHIFAGLLDLSGTYRRSRKRPYEIPIGGIVTLTLPELQNDERWEPTPLMTTTEFVGRDVPVGVSASPNRALVGLSSFLPESRISVHSLPRRRPTALPPPIPSSNLSPESRTDLAKLLGAAIYNRNSPSDAVSLLISHTGQELLPSTLVGTMSILENNLFGLGDIWMHAFLGVLVEIARGKYTRASDSDEKALWNLRWTAVHDMCSVAVLNFAFAECRDGDSYDLTAIWQLVGLSVWFLDFLEKVIKDCVYIGDSLALATGSMKPDFTNSIFLHFLHPYALKNLYAAVNHIKHFRDVLKSLNPKVENTHMAKAVLMDAVVSVGVDLDALIPVLEEVKSILTSVSASDVRLSLASFSPLPSLQSPLQQIIDKILNSKTVNRPKLFIKTSELIEDASQYNMAEQKKERERDVVTKGILLHRHPILSCVRCGGRYEVSDGRVGGQISARWRVWERRWVHSCICGGSWMSSSNPL